VPRASKIILMAGGMNDIISATDGVTQKSGESVRSSQAVKFFVCIAQVQVECRMFTNESTN
jgi:hypothetical protein